MSSLGGPGANLAHPSRLSHPAGRPRWRPRGNAALLFEIIPLTKYLVTADHYVAVMMRLVASRLTDFSSIHCVTWTWMVGVAWGRR